MTRWYSNKTFAAISLLALMSGAVPIALQEQAAANQATIAQASTAPVAPPKPVAPAKKVTRVFTPAENNAICVKMYSGAWNQGKLELLDEYIAPNGLDHSPLSTETGTAGFKKIITTFRQAMPNLKLTIEDEVYNKDRVVHRWKVQGKHTGAPLFGVPASGKDITLTGVSILRMENGKIAERWTNLDQFGLMLQLGIIPPPKAPPTGAK